MRNRKITRAKMRMVRTWYSTLGLLSLLLLLGIAMAGCGKATSGNGGNGGASSTVSMNSTNFTQHSLTVAVNQPVHFSDTTDGGGLHIICVGTGNGGTNSCLKSGNAPAGLLGSGTTFNPGDTKDFTFTIAGIYHVICTIHPGMYIDITVH